MKTTRRYGSRSWECPECHEWIEKRQALDSHIHAQHPALYAKRKAYVAELCGEVVA